MPESFAPAHGVVVLAAGGSSRLGRNKLLLHHEGEALVRRAARLALQTAPLDAVVVLGAEADAVFAQIRDLPIRRVDCAGWCDGMSASLRAGTAALSAECAGALVVLCDQPALEAAHLCALRDAWRASGHAAASLYAHRLGVPALLPRSWFAQIPARGDRGARDLFVARRAEVQSVSNEALAADIDRPEDIDALR